MNSNGVPTALWVVPVPEFGGVARHVVDMARAGLPGFNLVVLAPEGKLTSRLEELGVTVIKAEFGPDCPQPPGVCRRCRDCCSQRATHP